MREISEVKGMIEGRQAETFQGERKGILGEAGSIPGEARGTIRGGKRAYQGMTKWTCNRFAE